MANINILEGIRCGECGWESNFSMAVIITGYVDVTDDGYYYGNVEGDADFDYSQPATCGGCGHTGPFSDFCTD